MTIFPKKYTNCEKIIVIWKFISIKEYEFVLEHKVLYTQSNNKSTSNSVDADSGNFSWYASKGRDQNYT